MKNWDDIRRNTERFGLDFNQEKLRITNREFLDCLSVLERCIPDERLNPRASHGNFDFICGWTDQLLRVDKKESLAAIPVLASLAHAYSVVKKLPGGEFLISEIPKHEAIGLFSQLLITYFLSRYVPVIAVEQDRKRVDIVIQINDKKVNLHVKGTDPTTKSRNQFVAFAQLTHAMNAKPIINSNGEKLGVTLFDGYVPSGIDEKFWSNFWDRIMSKPVESLEIVLPGVVREPNSKLRLEFSWSSQSNGLKGEIRGINAFQNVIHRIKDIDSSIPQSSCDLEIAILVNMDANYLEVSPTVFLGRRLDGVMSIGISPGSLGHYYTRSKIFVKPEHAALATILEKAIPSNTWLC